jgi:hypothetical protein
MIFFLSVFLYRFFEFPSFKKSFEWWQDNVVSMKNQERLEMSRLSYAFSYAKTSCKQRHEMFLEAILVGDFSLFRDYYGKYAFIW